jgi:hypothetical protein
MAQYLLRVVNTGGDMLLTSNTLRLRIGRPTDRDTDRFAHEFFTPEVGLALVVNGSQSPLLRAGMDRLREAAERFATSEIGAKAAYTVAHSVGNDFYRRRDHQLVRSHEADTADALALTDPAVTYYREGNRNQNLAYHRLIRLRAQLHAKADAVSAARAELESLHSDLSERGVNQPVLKVVGGNAITALQRGYLRVSRRAWQQEIGGNAASGQTSHRVAVHATPHP